jgi:hypothetical protein
MLVVVSGWLLVAGVEPFAKYLFQHYNIVEQKLVALHVCQ